MPRRGMDMALINLNTKEDGLWWSIDPAEHRPQASKHKRLNRKVKPLLVGAGRGKATVAAPVRAPAKRPARSGRRGALRSRGR